MKKTGILLINLGTPDHCDTKSVRRYLTEFLNDPRVVDLPKIARSILVNGLIIPFRAKKSAALYQSIWREEGSPLLYYGLKLKSALSDLLGKDYQVALGMRYGNPTIRSALLELKDCRSITVLPLFPQYSSAATGSAIQKCLEELAMQWNIPSINIISEFHNNDQFISAYATIIEESTKNQSSEMLLFSYHGLPERHLTKSECLAACDHIDDCPIVGDTNYYCYRAQCYATTHLIAQKLGLSPSQYRVAFQSRLGRTPWIKPYTDELLPRLREQGIKNITMVSPSFVADCLETLEEINIRAREQWHSLGGENFTFVPCLNDHPNWIKAVADIVK